uniref:C-type lectin domain-containing protein n=1 Tax=Acrobeloides nanus TaxID=290746 RepID=A0A914CJJ8_9BILA
MSNANAWAKAEMLRHFSMYLEGEALSAYESLDKNIRENLDSLTKALKEKLEDQDVAFQARMALMSRTQQANETVLEFGVAIKNERSVAPSQIRCILLLAERICNNLNGHLTSICDTLTNEYLRNAASNSFTKYDDNDFWFGLAHNGNYVWNWTDSNTSCSFNNWINGVPSKGGKCASFSISTGKWSATHCSKHKPFICMVPKEIPSCPHVTNPRCPHVTNPSCLYDYVYFDKTNSCYKKLFNKTFYEANIECQKEGANLASIHSEEENRFLTTELATLNIYMVRLG